MFTDDFFTFMGNMRREGLEYYGKYYGLYTATVSDNADPEKLGRIKVAVSQFSDTPLDGWFRPAFMQAGNGYGWFWPPEVGDIVVVCFLKGDPQYPAWYFGGWCSSEATPYSPKLGYPDAEETPPSRRGFVTKTGHALILNEEADKEEVSLTWKKSDKEANVKLLPSGGIQVKTADGSQVFLDAENKKVVIEDTNNSNVITMDSSGVKISTKGKVTVDGATSFDVSASSISLGGMQSAVLGDLLLTWLTAHVHPTPGSPAVPPPPSALLSNKVKLG